MRQEAGPGPTLGDHALTASGQVSEQRLGKGVTLVPPDPPVQTSGISRPVPPLGRLA